MEATVRHPAKEFTRSDSSARTHSPASIEAAKSLPAVLFHFSFFFFCEGHAYLEHPRGDYGRTQGAFIKKLHKRETLGRLCVSRKRLIFLVSRPWRPMPAVLRRHIRAPSRFLVSDTCDEIRSVKLSTKRTVVLRFETQRLSSQGSPLASSGPVVPSYAFDICCSSE